MLHIVGCNYLISVMWRMFHCPFPVSVVAYSS